MRKIIYLFAVFIIISCNNNQKSDSKKVSTKKSTSNLPKHPIKIQYTDQQLNFFLDSVGRLPTQSLAEKAAFGVDSVFKNQPQLDTTISLGDFNKLKHAVQKGVIAVKTARRIFGNNKIDSACNEKSVLLTYKSGLIPVIYYPFDKNRNVFNEYAICIGDPEHCENAYLYFFKGNRIIAKRNGYNRDGLDLHYYKDADRRTVIHYKVEFDRGSGIWWYQFFFYKYDGNKLIPVLNIPQNINLLQPSPWGVRELWFESFVQKTNPLVIKMVYHQQLPDTVQYDHFTTDPNLGPMIVNDSTVVQYTWNDNKKVLEGHYEQSKIRRSEILSYYFEDNELLFINAYYETLKTLIRDKTKKKSALHYLNEVKNYYRKN
jgi:hypothetical protein